MVVERVGNADRNGKASKLVTILEHFEAYRRTPISQKVRSRQSGGILYGMKSTMDSAGRLVIPKDTRREAGIRPGMPLDVRVRDGRIEIEPAPLTIRLEKRGRFLIAVTEEQVPVLTSEDVEATRDRLRREREGK